MSTSTVSMEARSFSGPWSRRRRSGVGTNEGDAFVWTWAYYIIPNSLSGMDWRW